jgi:hypothetical protein
VYGVKRSENYAETEHLRPTAIDMKMETHVSYILALWDPDLLPHLVGPPCGWTDSRTVRYLDNNCTVTLWGTTVCRNTPVV